MQVRSPTETTRPSVGAGTVSAITQTGRIVASASLDGIPEGASPSAALVPLGSLLYGTAYAGGSSACSGFGCGTVFAVKP